MKPLGRLVLIVAVGACVAGVATLLTRSPRDRTSEEKILKWESLEGQNGSDLQRAKTPDGWLVENCDGYLMTIHDPEHKWLADDEE